MLKMWQPYIHIVQFSTLANTFQRLALYTTSSCNLNCKYCYEKNYREGLQISHPQDYSIYIEKLLELNPKNRETLISIELWGGEPLLGLEEFISYLPDFIKNFPNLKEIQLSSNFIIDNASELINKLCHRFNEWQPEGIVKLQISIDGPEKITDYNRGPGVTDIIVSNINKLYSNNLYITTNSNFSRKNLFSFLTYDDMENWFNFFLDNFPENIKFSLFKMNKTNIMPIGCIPDDEKIDIWSNDDGVRYAKILSWADRWRKENPELAKRFIWPDYKTNILSICAAGQPENMIALSPQGEKAICHRAIWEGVYDSDNREISQINLTNIYDYLMDQYQYYKDYLPIKDFKESMNIYISLNWCPYLFGYFDIGTLNTVWFSNEIPLLYNGAMNTLLKWSKEYGQN